MNSCNSSLFCLIYVHENLHRNTPLIPLPTKIKFFNISVLIYSLILFIEDKNKKWPLFACHGLLSIVNLWNKIYFLTKFL